MSQPDSERIEAVRSVFRALLGRYGPQSWWPADDPFEVMAGALLVQRTAWRNAAQSLQRLRRARALDCETLLRIPAPDLERLVKPAGFYRTKAARLRGLAAFVSAEGGLARLSSLSTESLRERLLRVPGIGAETADAILLYAFERPVFVVDAYARRMLRRLEGGDSIVTDQALKADAERALPHAADLNELHALIVEHSKRHCRAVPVCAECCLRSRCRASAALLA